MDITRKEKAAFAVAGAGQNMVNTLIGTFLLTATCKRKNCDDEHQHNMYGSLTGHPSFDLF